jgi:hypothetical protein
MEVFDSPIPDEARFAIRLTLVPGQSLPLKLPSGVVEVSTSDWMPWLDI